MKKNTIIFDLDGTLLNSLEDLTDSTNFALKCLNYPPKTIDEVRNFVGNGVAKLIERAIPYGSKNENYAKCLNIFKEYYSKNMFNKTKPYNGIISMLNTLKNNNIKIAVVSNKFDNAVKFLCEKYFSGLIDFAIGENEKNGINKKPAPDTVFIALQKLNAKKENAFYIGDSEVDIQTAKNSGIECISVTWGFKDREFLLKHGAKNIINSPEEIINYL